MVSLVVPDISKACPRIEPARLISGHAVADPPEIAVGRTAPVFAEKTANTRAVRRAPVCPPKAAVARYVGREKPMRWATLVAAGVLFA